MLTWSSRKGSASRAQKIPGRTSTTSPVFGGAANGNSSVSGMARVDIGSSNSIERRKARRRGRGQPSVRVAPVDAARRIVRMGGGLGEGQHRSEADVAPFEQRAPVGARPARKQVAKARLEGRPSGDVVLSLRIDVRKTELFEQLRIELRLERAERDEPSVGAGVSVVERR